MEETKKLKKCLQKVVGANRAIQTPRVIEKKVDYWQNLKFLIRKSLKMGAIKKKKRGTE